MNYQLNRHRVLGSFLVLFLVILQFFYSTWATTTTLPDGSNDSWSETVLGFASNSSSTTASVINNETLEHCALVRVPPTTQVRLSVVNETSSTSSSSSSRWSLQALDSHGQPKHVGGDDFYVTYTAAGDENVTAAALIKDNEDGTYDLDFFTPPMRQQQQPVSAAHDLFQSEAQGGRLNIYHEYTCGIGKLPPPEKETWRTGGALYREYILQVNKGPRIRFYQLPCPNVTMNHLDVVIFFGDSIMQQFISLQRHVFIPDRVYIKGNVGQELKNSTLPNFLRKLKRWHGIELRKTRKKLGLVVGSSAWDILQSENVEQGLDFDNHVDACRQLVTEIRRIFPKVELFWKSPSSMHIHRVACRRNDEWCHDRVKYMSASRTEILHQKQKRLMEELSVPYLDLYSAYYLSADHTYPGDGRHFVPELNAMMLSWFYPNTTVRVSE